MKRTISPGELERDLVARLARVNQDLESRRVGSSDRARARRRRPRAGRGIWLALTGLAASAVFATTAFALVDDAGLLDVQVDTKEECATDTTNEGAIITFIGADEDSPCHDLVEGSSGSGVFEPFVRVQADGSEQGYNTDAKDAGLDFQYDEVGGSWTHSVFVSDIPVISEGGQLYWELFVDLNESNANNFPGPHISLNDVEVWFVTDCVNTPTTNEPCPVTGHPFSAPNEKVYDYSGDILIKDINAGSGEADLRYLVPLAEIDIPPDCGFKDPDCDTFFVLYSQWGLSSTPDGDYPTDATFEEWKVKTYPFVTVEKTATAAFTRTFGWTIDKSVTPEAWALFDGDSGTSDYTVALTKDAGTDSAWGVSGTITIHNPGELDAIVTSVTDQITGVPTNATVSCPGGLPQTLDENETLVCTYSAALPNGTDQTNTATVTLQAGTVFTDDAAVDFGAPTTVVNDTVHVTDTYAGGPQNQAFSASGSTTYSRTFDCPADEGSNGNTATIVETGQNDSASVTVTCYDLSVVKTADESRTRTWNWDIDKSVDPESWNLFDGDTGTSDYEIDVDKVDFTDSAFHVEGSITIHNNHPSRSATLTSVTDSISGFGGTVTVSCPATTVAAGADLVCTYEADLPDGTSRTNTATATQQNFQYNSAGVGTIDGTTAYHDTETIDFSQAVTTEVNAEINVTDSFGPTSYGPFTDDDTITYSRTFDCEGVEYTDGHGSYTADNTATIDETGESSSASVEVDCYVLDVDKDADESFDRTYEWQIEKSADQTTLVLMPGQMFEVNYTVTVDVAGSTDDNFHVEGDIEIDNPNPDRDADLTDVVDTISGFGGTVTVTCPSMTVPAGGSLTCTYDADLPDGATRTNTATATQQNYDFGSDGLGEIGDTTDYSGDASVNFSGATINEIDECVDVSDTNVGSLGRVCVADAPESFTYSIFVGPYTEADCGPQQVDNTADFVTNDTGATGDDTWTIGIEIPCPEGCTLTLGYWKTHNDSFNGGAPPDPNWELIGDVDGDGTSEAEDEDFFDTGKTWFEVFWTSVSGRPYYQLAHQWMAAYLNKLSIEDIGGSIPANVQTALTNGAALLDEYDGSEGGKSPDLKGKNAKTIRAQFVAIAGLLGAFNEGDDDIGPGHCDEDPTSQLTLSTSGFVIPPIGLLPLGFWAFRRRRSKE